MENGDEEMNRVCLPLSFDFEVKTNLIALSFVPIICDMRPNLVSVYVWYKFYWQIQPYTVVVQILKVWVNKTNLTFLSDKNH